MAAYLGSGVNFSDDVQAPAVLPTTLVSATCFASWARDPLNGLLAAAIRQGDRGRP